MTDFEELARMSDVKDLQARVANLEGHLEVLQVEFERVLQVQPTAKEAFEEGGCLG